MKVVLSAPAINKSGSGSSSTTPTTLTQPCEFNTCPTGSPATGFNATDSQYNSNSIWAWPVHRPELSSSSAQLCERVPVGLSCYQHADGSLTGAVISVDSVRFGIQTLSPKFFGGAPDLIVSGPNVGSVYFVHVSFSMPITFAQPTLVQESPAQALCKRQSIASILVSC